MPTSLRKNRNAVKKAVRNSQRTAAINHAVAEILEHTSERTTSVPGDVQNPDQQQVQPSIEIPNTQPEQARIDSPRADLPADTSMQPPPAHDAELVDRVKDVLTKFVAEVPPETPSEMPYNWDTETTGILLGAKIACLSKGWTTNKASNKVLTNKAIQEAFQERDKRVPSEAQIKNRFDALMKVYKEIHNLLSRSGEPFRWNASIQMIEADPATWKAASKAEKWVAKYKWLVVVCKDEMYQVFAKRTATGAYASGRENVDPSLDPALQENVISNSQRDSSFEGTSITESPAGSSRRGTPIVKSPGRGRSEISELVSLIRGKIEADAAAASSQADERRKALDVLNGVCNELGWSTTRKIKAWKLLDSSLNVDIVMTQTAEELGVWLEQEIPAEYQFM